MAQSVARIPAVLLQTGHVQAPSSRDASRPPNPSTAIHLTPMGPVGPSRLCTSNITAPAESGKLAMKAVNTTALGAKRSAASMASGEGGSAIEVAQKRTVTSKHGGTAQLPKAATEDQEIALVVSAANAQALNAPGTLRSYQVNHHITREQCFNFRKDSRI